MMLFFDVATKSLVGFAADMTYYISTIIMSNNSLIWYWVNHTSLSEVVVAALTHTFVTR
jgi:hypothetical protein